jgi:cyclopropane fatty-acyl-phospholipid synthase-like methyltransferase
MEVNDYGRLLSPAEIDAGMHREFVGGLWDELGALQFAFLQARGLQPHHRLVDVGCGALRGGVHFVRYLDPGHYFGIDCNASLISAGKRELEAAGLADRAPHLLISDKFALTGFATTFDAAIAVSVFTHLPMNHIVRCLVELRKVLKPDAHFYASYFEAPTPACLEPQRHERGGIVSHYDADPYHYAFAEIEWMANIAQMKVERFGDWGHPRDQRMLVFAVDG